MKILQLLLFVLAYQITKSSHLNGVEPRELMVNDHQDNVLSRDNFQEAVIEEGNPTKCNREILIAYGLHGLETSQVRKHRYCPAIRDNCCSIKDVQAQRKNWNNQFKFYIQRYYETFLYVFKYVLGFSAEAYLLATQYEQSDMLHCKNAAIDLISMNLNPKLTERIYFSVRDRIKKISKLRRGFYCIICDAQNQQMTSQFFQNTNNFSNDKVYLSQEFCEGLVLSSIESTYFDLYVVRKYLNNLNQLINCKTGSKENVEFEVSIQIKQTVKNCFYFKDRYFFFFCEKYCEQFQLTKPTPLFDGNVQQLQKFFEKLKKERHQAFRYPNNNILTDGVVFEENIISFNYTEIYKDMVFFRPITQQVLFDKYRTDVVFYGGVNPWLSVKKNKFNIILNYIENIKALMMNFQFCKEHPPRFDNKKRIYQPKKYQSNEFPDEYIPQEYKDSDRRERYFFLDVIILGGLFLIGYVMINQYLNFTQKKSLIRKQHQQKKPVQYKVLFPDKYNSDFSKITQNFQGSNLVLVFGTEDKFDMVNEINKVISIQNKKVSLMQRSNIEFIFVYITIHKSKILDRIEKENQRIKVVHATQKQIQQLLSNLKLFCANNPKIFLLNEHHYLIGSVDINEPINSLEILIQIINNYNMKLQPNEGQLKKQLSKLNEQITFLMELNQLNNDRKSNKHQMKVNKIMKIKFEDYQKLSKLISKRLIKMKDKDFMAYSKVLNQQIQNILKKYGDLDEQKYKNDIQNIKKNIKKNILEIVFIFAQKYQKEDLYAKFNRNLKQNNILSSNELKNLTHNRILNIKKSDSKKIQLLIKIFSNNLKSLKEKHQEQINQKIILISEQLQEIKENQAKLILVQQLNRENLIYKPEFKNLKKDLKIDEEKARNQIQELLKNKTKDIIQQINEQDNYSLLEDIIIKKSDRIQSSFHTSEKIEKMYQKSQRILDLNLDKKKQKFQNRFKNLEKQFKEDNLFNIQNQKPLRNTKRQLSLVNRLKKQFLFEFQQDNNDFILQVNKRVQQRLISQKEKLKQLDDQNNFFLSRSKSQVSFSKQYSITNGETEESRLFKKKRFLQKLKNDTPKLERTKSFSRIQSKNLIKGISQKNIINNITGSEKQVRNIIKNITQDQIELIEQLIYNFDDNIIIKNLLGIFKFPRTLTQQILQTVDKKRKSVFDRNLMVINKLNSDVYKKHNNCYSFLCKLKNDSHQCPISFNNYHDNQLKQVRNKRREIKQNQLENIQQNFQQTKKMQQNNKKKKSVIKNKRLTTQFAQQNDSIAYIDSQLTSNYFEISNSSQSNKQKQNQQTNLKQEGKIKNKSQYSNQRYKKSTQSNFYNFSNESQKSQNQTIKKINRQQKKKPSTPQFTPNNSNINKSNQIKNQKLNQKKKKNSQIILKPISLQSSNKSDIKQSQTKKKISKPDDILFKKKSLPSSEHVSALNDSDNYLYNINTQQNIDDIVSNTQQSENIKSSKKSQIEKKMENDMINSYKKMLKPKVQKKSEYQRKIEAEKKKVSSRIIINRAKRMDTQILPVRQEDILSSFENKRITRLTKISSQSDIMDYLKPSDDETPQSNKINIENPFVLSKENEQSEKVNEDKQYSPKKINAHFTRTISEPFEFRESNRYSRTDAIVKASDIDSMDNYFDQI